jgi:hypothetical protein
MGSKSIFTRIYHSFCPSLAPVCPQCIPRLEIFHYKGAIQNELAWCYSNDSALFGRVNPVIF